jgi:L-seryl-tRNA(Ser) seleniumtransferase
MHLLMNDLRRLPSVEKILQYEKIQLLVRQVGRSLVVDAVRRLLNNIRLEKTLPSSDLEMISRVKAEVERWVKPTLVQLINATGVVLHTNLGRAPLSASALAAIHSVSIAYSTLEYDLDKGERGQRSTHVESLLVRLTGAQGALVVNNNAAAVLLVLTALARRQRVIISRTQLVEIGGGFRIPEVMEQSGAKLVSIGTTNRVHLRDYQDALRQPAGLVLCAHQSNFRIIGFTNEPSIKEVAEVAHVIGIPLVHDLGSGALLDTARFGIAHEPTVQESLVAGADIVCFSGDKLLGGPQAGIILGRQELLEKVRRHPLARALRADKTCLAGLSATLLHYLKNEAEKEIPVWQMLSASPSQLKKRVKSWQKRIGLGEVVPGLSMVGGGSLPGESQPTFLYSLLVGQPNAFLKKLRQLPVPIVARIESDRVVFDPRTILPAQEDLFLDELKSILH